MADRVARRPRSRCLPMAVAFISAVVIIADYRTTGNRYKVTVEVDTPDGPRTGSAVRAINVSHPSPLPSLTESKPLARLDGEAVVVALPAGRYLFATLTSEGGDRNQSIWLPGHLYGWLKESGRGEGDLIELWPTQPDMRGESPPRPMLVTFEDLSKPTSIVKVEPDHLAEVFGPGYALKRVTFQRSSGSVTRKIREVLPWLEGSPVGLDSSVKFTFHPTFAQSVKQDDLLRLNSP